MLHSPFIGLRARTHHAFILPASLFPYSVATAAISRTCYLTLPCTLDNASPCWPKVQKSLTAPSPPALGASASFKSSHAAADLGPVKVRVSFLALTLPPSFPQLLPCQCPLLSLPSASTSAAASLPGKVPFCRFPLPLLQHQLTMNSCRHHDMTQHEAAFSVQPFHAAPSCQSL